MVGVFGQDGGTKVTRGWYPPLPGVQVTQRQHFVDPAGWSHGVCEAGWYRLSPLIFLLQVLERRMASLLGTASSTAQWGLDPAMGAQHPASGIPQGCWASPGSLGVVQSALPSGLEWLLLALGALSVGAGIGCHSTRCPQAAPAPVPGGGRAASGELNWYPRKRECSCFNYLAAVRTWCGGN